MLLSHVVEHLADGEAETLVEQYLPYLRDGGRVIIITPQEAGYRSDPTHLTFVDFDASRTLANRVGCTVERSFSFPFPRAAGRVFRYNEFVTVAVRDRG